MVIIPRSVNFGTAHASLSTVGYTLKNFDGTTKLARATAGIVELVTAKGIYGGNIAFDDGWDGFIIWDTGEGSPVYASENFHHAVYAGAGFIGSWGNNGLPGPKPSLSDRDKKKMFKLLNDVLALVRTSATLAETAAIMKKLSLEENHKHALRESINLIQTKVDSQEKILEPLVNDIKNLMEPLAGGIHSLIEAQEFKMISGEVEDV